MKEYALLQPKHQLVGVDVLKLLCMFKIVILHINNHEKTLEISGGGGYWIAWGLQILCYGAVNCFAMVSGYTISASKVKYNRIVNLWFQVFFYSVLILVAGYFLNWGISKRLIMQSLLPISGGLYWYISCYFLMTALIPFLNAAIAGVTKCQYKICFLLLFVLQSVIPDKLFGNVYGLGGGFSVLWLVEMYLIGGYIRKYNVCIEKKKCFKVFIASNLVIMAWKLILEEFIGVGTGSNVLVSYLSPAVIISSVSLFLCLLRLDTSKILANRLHTIAKYSLGVYLFHDHPLCGDKQE